MVAVIVAAHGRLAEGLIASSAMIAGPQEDLVAVTFDPSEGPDDLLAKYAAAVEKSSSDHYLILVDLLGGLVLLVGDDDGRDQVAGLVNGSLDDGHLVGRAAAEEEGSQLHGGLLSEDAADDLGRVGHTGVAQDVA